MVLMLGIHWAVDGSIVKLVGNTNRSSDGADNEGAKELIVATEGAENYTKYMEY